MESPTVGREAELARLAGLLAPTGRFENLVIAGEPGIGKSRLLDEFTRLAGSAGVVALTGRATEFERSAPFGVWFDLIADADRQGALAGHLDRLRGVLSGGTGDGAAGAIERHRVHTEVRALLDRAAPDGGLALLFDDVHWADDASAEVIDFLLRHPPAAHILIGLTVRDGRLPHRLAHSTATLAHPVARLDLGPLTSSDADVWLSGEPSRLRRSGLYQASGGNPLFLGILAGLSDVSRLSLSGAAPADVDDRDMTGALDRLIVAELAALEPRSRLIAQAMAVAGSGDDLDLVAAIAGVGRTGTDPAVDDLVSRAVLRAGPGAIVFRHPLIRAAAYRMAGPAWRAGAHRRAFTFLRGRGASPAQCAMHLEQAARTGSLDDARLLAAAGTEALATAPAAAVRWLSAALRALPVLPDLDPLRIELRLSLARALRVSGRPQESRVLLHDLLRPEHGWHRGAVVRLLALTERASGNLPEARAIVRAELDRPAGATERAELLVELASTDLLDGRLDDTVRHATGALELIAPGSRRGIEALAVTMCSLAELYRCSFADGGRLLERAGSLMDGLSDPELGEDLEVVVPLAWGEFLLDRNHAALRRLDRGLRVARRFGRDHVIPMNYAIRAVIRIRLGEVTEAIADATDALEVARYAGNDETQAFLRNVLARPLLWSSGPAAAMATVQESLAVRPLKSLWWRTIVDHGLGEILLSVGDAASCRALLAARASSDPVGLGPNAVSTYAMRAQAEAVCGDLLAAQEWHARAAALADSGAPQAQSGCVARAGAVIAQARGDQPAAVRAAGEAVERFVEAGIPIGEAFARLVLAEASGGNGDVRASRRELGRARELFDGCGAPWLARLVGREQRRVGANLARRSRTPDDLSAREREVAELVAQGLTNRVIGERLFVSPRTVETHLTRVFQKLGVTTRSAVARRLTDAPG